MTTLNIVLAQQNFLVGDIVGNCKKIKDTVLDVQTRLGAELVIFPELALSGYPPEDWLLRADFLSKINQAIVSIQSMLGNTHVLLGLPQKVGTQLYNSAIMLNRNGILAQYHKQVLPNYGVFDEKRYFSAGQTACVVELKGIPIGISICEDLWDTGPASSVKAQGAQLLININASPYHMGKRLEREQLLRQRCREIQLPIIYCNLVGGQDELVFDGESLVVDAAGQLCLTAPAFEEHLTQIQCHYHASACEISPGTIYPALSPVASIYQALVLGIRDYIVKNGFKSALLGLSGGIDSALTAVLAVDALGAANVEAVMLPSQYTSNMSLEDAQRIATNLSISYQEIPIQNLVNTFLTQLHPVLSQYATRQKDVTAENIQARCRAVLLMALSNRSGKLLLTTGNKSEMAVGYATLYGDMAGGFAPLKDVSKTLVYQLAAYRNTLNADIPQRVFERAPSAELAPGQTDQDTLPAYSLLDNIITAYVENNQGEEDMVAAGLPRETVQKVIKMILAAEFKRRQSPPGLRITPRAFGRDWRYPISSGFGRN